MANCIDRIGKQGLLGKVDASCADYRLIAEGKWVNGTLVTIIYQSSVPTPQPSSLPPGLVIGSLVLSPTIMGVPVVFNDGGVGGWWAIYCDNRWSRLLKPW